MWQERREGWTESGRRERWVQIRQRMWATVDTTIAPAMVQPVEKEAIEIVKPPRGPIVDAQPVVQAPALEPQVVQRPSSGHRSPGFSRADRRPSAFYASRPSWLHALAAREPPGDGSR